MNAKLLLVLLLLGALAGCGTIETHEQVSQPTTKVLDTYIGGTILKVERTRPLPNAFGGADIFGRKVYAGYTELRYQGMTDDGRILLRVTEVETHSTETTMSRSGQSSFNGYADAYGNVHGAVTHSPQGSTEILPPNTTQFAFDATKEKDLTIAGVRVHFSEFTPQSLKYSLDK
jgi:hypothetical protein